MRRIRVVICSVEEETPDEMTELACFDLPAADVTTLHPETALDDLETTTHETGNAILRRVLQAQWDTLDAQLMEQHRQRFSPKPVTADGHEPITVASRAIASSVNFCTSTRHSGEMGFFTIGWPPAAAMLASKSCLASPITAALMTIMMRQGAEIPETDLVVKNVT